MTGQTPPKEVVSINKPKINAAYGPNNPEPPGLHRPDAAPEDITHDALHAAAEYLYGLSPDGELPADRPASSRRGRP